MPKISFTPTLSTYTNLLSTLKESHLKALGNHEEREEIALYIEVAKHLMKNADEKQKEKLISSSLFREVVKPQLGISPSQRLQSLENNVVRWLYELQKKENMVETLENQSERASSAAVSGASLGTALLSTLLLSNPLGVNTKESENDEGYMVSSDAEYLLQPATATGDKFITHTKSDEYRAQQSLERLLFASTDRTKVTEKIGDEIKKFPATNFVFPEGTTEDQKVLSRNSYDQIKELLVVNQDKTEAAIKLRKLIAQGVKLDFVVETKDLSGNVIAIRPAIIVMLQETVLSISKKKISFESLDLIMRYMIKDINALGVINGEISTLRDAMGAFTVNMVEAFRKVYDLKTAEQVMHSFNKVVLGNVKELAQFLDSLSESTKTILLNESIFFDQEIGKTQNVLEFMLSNKWLRKPDLKGKIEIILKAGARSEKLSPTLKSKLNKVLGIKSEASKKVSASSVPEQLQFEFVGSVSEADKIVKQEHYWKVNDLLKSNESPSKILEKIDDLIKEGVNLDFTVRSIDESKLAKTMPALLFICLNHSKPINKDVLERIIDGMIKDRNALALIHDNSGVFSTHTIIDLFNNVSIDEQNDLKQRYGLKTAKEVESNFKTLVQNGSTKELAEFLSSAAYSTKSVLFKVDLFQSESEQNTLSILNFLTVTFHNSSSVELKNELREKIELVIAAGEDIKQMSEPYRTMLEEIIEPQEVDTQKMEFVLDSERKIKFLYDKPVSVGARKITMENLVVFVAALKNNDLEKVQNLLKQGLKPNFVVTTNTGAEQETVIRYPIAFAQKLEALQILLDEGCDINSASKRDDGSYGTILDFFIGTADEDFLRKNGAKTLREIKQGDEFLSNPVKVGAAIVGGAVVAFGAYAINDMRKNRSKIEEEEKERARKAAQAEKELAEQKAREKERKDIKALEKKKRKDEAAKKLRQDIANIITEPNMSSSDQQTNLEVIESDQQTNLEDSKKVLEVIKNIEKLNGVIKELKNPISDRRKNKGTISDSLKLIDTLRTIISGQIKNDDVNNSSPEVISGQIKNDDVNNSSPKVQNPLSLIKSALLRLKEVLPVKVKKVENKEVLPVKVEVENVESESNLESFLKKNEGALLDGFIGSIKVLKGAVEYSVEKAEIATKAKTLKETLDSELGNVKERNDIETEAQQLNKLYETFKESTAPNIDIETEAQQLNKLYKTFEKHTAPNIDEDSKLKEHQHDEVKDEDVSAATSASSAKVSSETIPPSLSGPKPSSAASAVKMTPLNARKSQSKYPENTLGSVMEELFVVMNKILFVESEPGILPPIFLIGDMPGRIGYSKIEEIINDSKLPTKLKSRMIQNFTTDLFSVRDSGVSGKALGHKDIDKDIKRITPKHSPEKLESLLKSVYYMFSSAGDPESLSGGYEGLAHFGSESGRNPCINAAKLALHRSMQGFKYIDGGVKKTLFDLELMGTYLCDNPELKDTYGLNRFQRNGFESKVKEFQEYRKLAQPKALLNKKIKQPRERELELSPTPAAPVSAAAATTQVKKYDEIEALENLRKFVNDICCDDNFYSRFKKAKSAASASAPSAAAEADYSATSDLDSIYGELIDFCDTNESLKVLISEDFGAVTLFKVLETKFFEDEEDKKEYFDNFFEIVNKFVDRKISEAKEMTVLFEEDRQLFDKITEFMQREDVKELLEENKLDQSKQPSSSPVINKPIEETKSYVQKQLSAKAYTYSRLSAKSPPFVPASIFSSAATPFVPSSDSSLSGRS